MNDKHCKVLFSALLAATAVVTLPAGSTAQQQHEHDGSADELAEGARISPSESWNHVFERIAALTGWSIEETQQHWEATEEIGRIADEIYSADPNALVGTVAGKAVDGHAFPRESGASGR